MISRCHHLVFCREVYPDLETVCSPPSSPELIVRLFRVNYSFSSGHPLNVTWVQLTAVTCAIFVLHPPIKEISHCFEPSVRVPGSSNGLARTIIDWAHFVYQQERTQYAVHPRGSTNLEPPAFPHCVGRYDIYHFAH